MKEYYIFIIWSEALWCKKRILNDIRSSFQVEVAGYARWKRREFDTNIERFYGWKINNGVAKTSECGKGKFFFVMISDACPQYEERTTSVGVEYVNVHLFDKKSLYREWVGGGSRIHCSNSLAETRHDISVLFDCTYQTLLDGFKGENNSWQLPLRLTPFSSRAELISMLNEFGNNCVMETEEGKYCVFCYCRKELLRFCRAPNINARSVALPLGNENVELLVFGEREGELPKGLFSLPQEEICAFTKTITNVLPEYIRCIENKDFASMPQTVESRAYVWQNPGMESLQQLRPVPLAARLKYQIKKLLLRLKYR